MSQVAAPSAFAKQSPQLFREGMLVNYNSEPYVIRTAQADFFVLQHTINKNILTLTASVWTQAYCNGDVTIEAPERPVVITPITDTQTLLDAERILAYVNELETRDNPGSERTRQRVIDYIAGKINDAEPPHPMQLYRWFKKWQKAGRDMAAFMNKRHTRTRPVTDSQFDFAMYIVDEYFLVKHGGNRSALYRIYTAEFAKEANRTRFQLTGKPMSKTALDNLLDSLEPFEVMAAQQGLSKARMAFRDSNEKIVTHFPGERVEIDAVHLNLGLIEEETGEYIGKVILYLAIDVHTRYILGYSIAYGLKPAESSEGVINLLRHTVSQKIRNGNFSHDWQCIGVPYSFHADNGAGFIAQNTLRFCSMLNTDLHRSESRKSQRRPFIERFNRTLREQLMEKIAGYLGKRIDEKDFDATIEQAATVTLGEFTRHLEHYIVDIYHQNPHRGLDGLSPAQKLKQCQNDFIERPAPNLATLNALVGQQLNRTVQETHGIQINGQYFHSTELKMLRFKEMKNRKNPKAVKMDVIFDSNDISSITVLLPDGIGSLIVPNRDKTIEPGTSLAQYKAMNAQGKAGYPTETYKTIEIPTRQRGKATRKTKKKTPKTSVNAPQSQVVTHESYDVSATLKDGANRLAKDERYRVPQQTGSVDMSPAATRPVVRTRSGGR